MSFSARQVIATRNAGNVVGQSSMECTPIRLGIPTIGLSFESVFVTAG